jgi:phenylalanyl-tRNA synthetase beta chain
VLDVEELTGFKKPIRYCHVDDRRAHARGRLRATNFAPATAIAFATPGAVLPGDFRIATRQTYGHTSDGMICPAPSSACPTSRTGSSSSRRAPRWASTSWSCSRCATRCSTSQ